MQAPCKGCEDRQVGCHSSCPRYKEFDEYNESMRQARYEAMEVRYLKTKPRKRKRKQSDYYCK